MPDPAKIGDTASTMSWNSYLYVNDDPVNLRDSSGLSPEGPLQSSCWVNGKWWPAAYCDFILNKPYSAWQQAEGVIGLGVDWISGAWEPSQACNDDLTKAGTNAETLRAAAQSVQFVNGTGSTDLVSSLYVGSASAAASSAQAIADAAHGVTDWTIGNEMSSRPNVAAMSQIGYGFDPSNFVQAPSKVYVNPGYFADSRFLARDISTMMHELLHVITGQDDAGLKDKMGLPADGTPGSMGSFDISLRLLSDCVIGSKR